MTREEAIQILSTRDAHGVLCGYTNGVTEALDMAIEALSVYTDTEQSDLISREKAIESMELESAKEGAYGYIDIKSAVETLEELPSADAVSREEYEGVKAYMDTLVDAFIEDGEELAESVKVVRCKDCRQYIPHDLTDDRGWCCEYKTLINEDDYCSYGDAKMKGGAE